MNQAWQRSLSCHSLYQILLQESFPWTDYEIQRNGDFHVNKTAGSTFAVWILLNIVAKIIEKKFIYKVVVAPLII